MGLGKLRKRNPCLRENLVSNQILKLFGGGIVVGIGTLLALSASGCREATPSGALPDRSGMERTIYVQATEMDARRAVERDPFPRETVAKYPEYFGDGEDPFERGGAPGYYLFMTSEDEWRIGSYMFVPQEVIAYQGERLTLEIFGVRGGTHGTILEDPEGNRVQEPDGEDIVFSVHRGELKKIEFTVEKSGIYHLICYDHQPTMVMNIHVLPRGQ